jgi:hypothetical protein
MQAKKEGVRGRQDHDELTYPSVQTVKVVQAAEGTLEWTDAARQNEVRSPRCDAKERPEVGNALQSRNPAESVLR